MKHTGVREVRHQVSRLNIHVGRQSCLAGERRLVARGNFIQALTFPSGTSVAAAPCQKGIKACQEVAKLLFLFTQLFQALVMKLELLLELLAVEFELTSWFASRRLPSRSNRSKRLSILSPRSVAALMAAQNSSRHSSCFRMASVCC